MGLFFGGSSSKTPASTGLNRFQKQSSSGVRKTLSGLSAEKRKRVEAVLGGKIKSGLSNDKILRAVGSTLGYGAKQKVESAMKPQVDESAIKERLKRNLTYARSQRVATEREIEGGLSRTAILGNALKGQKGSAADLGVGVAKKTTGFINSSTNSGGFVGGSK